MREKYDWLVNLSANNTASLVIAFSIFAARGFKNKSLLCSKTLPLKQSDNCVLLYYSSVFASNSPHHHKQKLLLLLYFFFCYTEQLLHYNDHSVCVVPCFHIITKMTKTLIRARSNAQSSLNKNTHISRDATETQRFIHIWGLLQQFWGALTLSSQFHTLTSSSPLISVRSWPKSLVKS